MPLSRAAALMRAIQSERKSRRRTRRPRADCIIARSTASTARLKQPLRRPRKPLASLRTRFLRRRALNPRLTRISAPDFSTTGDCPEARRGRCTERRVWLLQNLLREPVRQAPLEVLLVAAREDQGFSQS